MSLITLDQKGHEQLLREGYKVASSKSWLMLGGSYDERVYRKEIPCPDAAARITGYAFCLLLSTSLLACCHINAICNDYCATPRFTENYCYDPCSGHENLVAHVINQVKSDDLYRRDYEQLGFDPTDKNSMRDYMNRHIADAHRHLGHEFLCYHTPFSKSSCFLFAPNGDRSNISLRTAFHPADGRNLSSKELFERAKKTCEEFGPGQEEASVVLPTRPKLNIKKPAPQAIVTTKANASATLIIEQTTVVISREPTTTNPLLVPLLTEQPV